jgi:hypothetical protein
MGNAGQIGIYVSVAMLVLASQALAIEFKTPERCQRVWERYSQCTRNVGSSACENELWQSCEKIPEPKSALALIGWYTRAWLWRHVDHSSDAWT